MSNNSGSSLILMGIKHSGKTTQGQLIARTYGCPFFDTDDIITQITGIPPRTVYTMKGPEGFMAAEESACRKLADNYAEKRVVISTGGGICDNQPALMVLRPMGKFIFISVPEQLACDRIISKITTDSDGTLHNVPAYIAKKSPHTEADVRAVFHDYYFERSTVYRSIADVVVELGNAAKQANCGRILAALT